MAINLDNLGFMSGLEVHHQLATEKKLFCKCPVRLTAEKHDVELLRHMRPTLSELGEYDGTALMEFKTKKEVVYQVFRDINCTYEMDDTPPFLINQQALDYAIHIALLFDLSLVDELHISRKQYLDGSIPTGFQRTAIIGVDGGFEMNGRRIRVLHLGLEEDACREVSDSGHTIVFRADRLGTPLVEVVTAPDFRTPEEVRQGAEIIRKTLWSSGRVRRGPGSVRQDVNVSVTGGTRIEIKGVPRINMIPELVTNEALRQHNLLKIRDELRMRGVTYKTLETNHTNVTRLLSQSDNAILNSKSGMVIEAVRLKGFGGLLSKPTQNGTTFADEFSGRVRVIACLDQLPNILFQNSPGAEGISDGIWRKIRKRLDATHHDAVILTYGSKEDVETAFSEIIIRAKDATLGIPSETRQARKNGTNDFERILPGPDRMYPDTDHPPLPIDDQRIARIKSELRPAPWKREAHLQQFKLSADVIQTLSFSPCFTQVLEISTQFPNLVTLIGSVFTRINKSLSRKGLNLNTLTRDAFIELFQAIEDNRLFQDVLTQVLQTWIKQPEIKLEKLLAKINLYPASETEIQETLRKALSATPPRPCKSPDAAYRYAMGVAMKTLRGRAPGSSIAEKLKDLFKTAH